MTNQLPENRKYKIIFLVSFVITVFSFALRVFLMSDIAAKSVTIEELNSRKLLLSKEVSQLEVKNMEISSIAYIESRALELGFSEGYGTTLTLDLKAGVPVAAAFQQ